MTSLASAMAGLLGLDPAAAGVSNLERAARERMLALGIDSGQVYLRALRLDPEERRLACGLAIVGETWFFRDPGVFDHLGRQAQAMNRPIKVLCAPCSTGEEAYGAALALMGAGLRPQDFLIDAFDANTASVEAARAGTFGPSSFRNPPPGLARRFESLDDGRRRVPPEAARRVRFRPGDLLGGGLGLGGGPYQLVLCRNFAMYLAPEARNRLGATLAALMAPEAVLYVGHAEVTVFSTLGFSPLGLPGSFACVLADPVRRQTPPAWSLPGPLRMAPRPKRRAGLDRPLSPAPGVSAPAAAFAKAGSVGLDPSAGSPRMQSAPGATPNLPAVVDRSFQAGTAERAQAADPGGTQNARAARPAPPGAGSASSAMVSPRAGRDASAPARVGIEPGAPARAGIETGGPAGCDDARERAVRTLADAGRLREALALAQTSLDQGPPTAELFHLLAVAHLGLDQKDQAEQALRRAVYLSPNHVEALTLLELLAAARGDDARAALLARRAQRAAAFREVKP